MQLAARSRWPEAERFRAWRTEGCPRLNLLITRPNCRACKILLLKMHKTKKMHSLVRESFFLSSEVAGVAADPVEDSALQWGQCLLQWPGAEWFQFKNLILAAWL